MVTNIFIYRIKSKYMIVDSISLIATKSKTKQQSNKSKINNQIKMLLNKITTNNNITKMLTTCVQKWSLIFLFFSAPVLSFYTINICFETMIYVSYLAIYFGYDACYINFLQIIHFHRQYKLK